MEFIKQMKKREFIEMGLKTLAAVLAGFLAIILMEGMIYGIELNALKTKSTTASASSKTTVAYCIKESDDKYFVIYYNEDSERQWSATQDLKTKAECEALEGPIVKEVVMHAPNAFKFSINGVHYVVMAVFISAIAGFFTYKFIALTKEYKKIEEEFKTSGTISFN